MAKCARCGHKAFGLKLHKDNLCYLCETEKMLLQQHPEFNIDKKITWYSYPNFYLFLALDDTSKQWAYCRQRTKGPIENLQVYKYSDIRDVHQDEHLITDYDTDKNNQTTIAKQLCDELTVTVELNSLEEPVRKIHFIFDKESVTNSLYQEARGVQQQVFQLLDYIKDQLPARVTPIADQEPPLAPAPVFSPADEILKYKQLLDMGAITAQEFAAKKKQLLDL